MYESLPPTLQSFVFYQADAMGLPGPDSYIELLIRLEKRRLEQPRLLATDESWAA